MAATAKARVQGGAPDFECTAVVDGAFEELSLTTYTSSKQWLILAFIPMAWTFVCPTEIIAFSEAVQQFKQRNAAVIFASTDSEYSLLAWNNASRRDGGLGGINIPLLSDKNHKLSRDYGVLLEEEGIALRGLFIIDPRGIIRQITINDLPVGRSVDEVLRLIDAFQFTEKHGEVCPANWNPGDAGIKEEIGLNGQLPENHYGATAPPKDIKMGGEAEVAASASSRTTNGTFRVKRQRS